MQPGHYIHVHVHVLQYMHVLAFISPIIIIVGASKDMFYKTFAEIGKHERQFTFEVTKTQFPKHVLYVHHSMGRWRKDWIMYNVHVSYIANRNWCKDLQLWDFGKVCPIKVANKLSTVSNL